jgi:glucose-1-phosphate thymidylyltransferase
MLFVLEDVTFMKAVILCAGYATRLYPYTIDAPKALLEVGDRPLLSYAIENIKDIADMDEIYVVTNNKFYPKFLSWSNNLDSRIEIINDNTKTNEERLGGVGDFAIALEKCVDDDIFVLLGDNFFNFPLKKFVDFFKESKKCCIALHDIKSKEEARKFGVLETRGNKIVGFEEKPKEPKSTLISTGAYIFPRDFTKKLRDYIDSGKNKEGIGYIIQDFIASGLDINGFVFDEQWYDIGTMEDYKRINEEIKGMKRK